MKFLTTQMKITRWNFQKIRFLWKKYSWNSKTFLNTNKFSYLIFVGVIFILRETNGSVIIILKLSQFEPKIYLQDSMWQKISHEPNWYILAKWHWVIWHIWAIVTLQSSPNFERILYPTYEIWKLFWLSKLHILTKKTEQNQALHWSGFGEMLINQKKKSSSSSTALKLRSNLTNKPLGH